MSDRRFSWLRVRFWVRQTQVALAAIAFYTCLPIPPTWKLDFNGIARLAPLVGLFLGGILSAIDAILGGLGVPALTRSVAVILTGIALTGGLHFDGAMDTADGLAVPDPQRRLTAMQDSVVGAFGVMAGIAIAFLKTAALADLSVDRTFALMAAFGWARWGQVVAIVRYPYLRPSGKGAIHKASIRSALDLIPGGLALLALSLLQLLLHPDRWLFGVGMLLGGSAIAILTGAWFNAKLGGHTGDTYGAVVEWTEAGVLCLLTALAAASG